MNKTRVIKGSNLPTVNISRELISVLSRLDGDEVKEIINGIRDYVYKDKEPNVNEEITDIMDMVLDNINHIAKGYLNGKKGGRPKKSTLQEVTSTEFDIPKTEDKINDNIEVEIKAILSPSNIKEVEEPQPIVEKPTESLKIAKNEVKQSIPLRVAASEDFTPSEKLQDLINNDDNFCTIYTRCINYIADYKLNPGDFVKSNSKNMVFSKLERILGESGIPFNEDIKNFINNDVSAKMNSLARLEKIA